MSNSEILRDFALAPLLNKYMRQDRKRDAGEQKHGHAEHRVRIFVRRTCSLVRFGLWRRRKRFFLIQVFHFSFLLECIGHLPIPSESFSGRGKKNPEIFSSHYGGTIAQMGPGPERFTEKSKDGSHQRVG